MSDKSMVIHIEIKATKGSRVHDLAFDTGSRTLYDVLVSMSQKEWARDLFTHEDDRVKLLPGYMMVLDSKMVQPWEVENTPVVDGQALKFVQVVPGG